MGQESGNGLLLSLAGEGNGLVKSLPRSSLFMGNGLVKSEGLVTSEGKEIMERGRERKGEPVRPC